MFEDVAKHFGGLYLRPDPARVVVRPFKPATEPRDLNPTDKVRANHIVDRVLRLDAEASAQQLREVLENFEGRHRNLLDIFEARAAEMEDALEPHAQLNKTQRGLIGAYFLNEYSFEASALFNPSIVRHPDQTGAPENGCRFILSLRAVGEGHISSIGFCTAVLGPEVDDGSIVYLLAKPVSRPQFVVGKYLGLVLTLAVNVAVMTLAIGIASAWVRDRMGLAG